MGAKLEDKLLEIYRCIEESCLSSIKIFDKKKGHSNRSVGFTAYEERQQKLIDLSNQKPDVIEFLCKKGGHAYFKFEGKTIKVISSTRENLSPNVFEKNMFERDQELHIHDALDPLLRVIYKVDYDLDNKEARLLECAFLKIDRNSREVVDEINIMSLARKAGTVPEGISRQEPDEIDLPQGMLIQVTKKEIANNDNFER